MKFCSMKDMGESGANSKISHPLLQKVLMSNKISAIAINLGIEKYDQNLRKK